MQLSSQCGVADGVGVVVGVAVGCGVNVGVEVGGMVRLGGMLVGGIVVGRIAAATSVTITGASFSFTWQPTTIKLINHQARMGITQVRKSGIRFKEPLSGY